MGTVMFPLGRIFGHVRRNSKEHSVRIASIFSLYDVIYWCVERASFFEEKLTNMHRQKNSNVFTGDI